MGIIAAGDLTQAPIDLATFASNNKLPATPVSVIYTGTKGTDVNGNAEWALDSQTIVGMSGGVKQLNFYAATSSSWSDITIAINRAVTDNTAPVVNMSMGTCESFAPTASVDQLLKLAAAQGQTFFVSSGDSGDAAPVTSTANCLGPSVEYPASSPYVVAVGGTTLYTKTDGSYANETVWSLGGGGISVREPIPSWQSSVSSLKGRAYRSLPDIAFDADFRSGAQIIVAGKLTQLGGTSLAAPLAAATWARMLSGSCMTKLGFAAPTLYTTAAQSPSVFRDITSGTNGAYNAAPGWDFVTGWGTPSVSVFHSVVCAPPSPIYGGRITEGTILNPGQYLYSPSGNHALVMQYDGNLVLYNETTGVALWSSNTSSYIGAFANFQPDGNLVVYSAIGQALWASSTNTAYAQTLNVQDDGNLGIYRLVPLFSTGTNTTSYANSASGFSTWKGGVSITNNQGFTSGNGANFLVMQSDGNLVLYRHGVAQWMSATQGHPGAYALMQGDGNLVVYNSANTALWITGTQGHPGAATFIQDDGNVVISTPVLQWTTGTTG